MFDLDRKAHYDKGNRQQTQHKKIHLGGNPSGDHRGNDIRSNPGTISQEQAALEVHSF